MNMTHKKQLAVVVGLLAATGLSPAAFAQQSNQEDSSANSAGSIRLSTGVSYSSGEYGELEETEVLAVPLALTWKEGPLKIRVSSSYVFIDGPGSLLSTPEGRDGGGGQGRGRGGDSDNSGSGSSNSGSGSGGSDIEVEDETGDDLIDDDGNSDNDGFAGADNTRSGIGDVNVSAVYSIDLGSDFFLEPGVKLKLPTASKAKRLGTGKVDVTLSSDLVKEIGDATFYVHGRHKIAGKSAGSTIRPTWGAGAGVSYAFDSVSIGADYDWQQSAFVGRKASSEITGWTNFKLVDGVGLTLYASTGLNSNSADLAAGASISVRF